MPGFFPTPFPDELFYSLAARYAAAVGYVGTAPVIRDLFGRNFRLGIWPRNLGRLVERLPDGHALNAETLIFEHTLLPLYRPFMESSRYHRAVDAMIQNSTDLWPSIRDPLTYTRRLRYCPACVQADRAEYGQAYWHRVHQIPGVLTCPIHKVSVEPYGGVDLAAPDGVPLVRAAVLQNIDESTRLVGQRQSFCDEIAADLAGLLWRAQCDTTVEQVRSRIALALAEKGLTTPGGVFRRRELEEHLVDHFGRDTLRALECDVSASGPDSWPIRVVRGGQLQSPLRYVLLARFAGLDLSDMVGSLKEPAPFGNGPWRCINPAADHYLEPRITEVKVGFDRKKRMTGTFSCACGFVFRRLAGTGGTEDNGEVLSVVARGRVWRARLRKLVVEKKSTHKIAQLLGVTSKVVKRLRCSGRTRTTRRRLDAKRRRKRQQYRRKILAVLNNQEAPIRSEIQRAEPAAYAWLLKWDREWLFGQLPARSKTAKRRVNWTARDLEISAAVLQAARELYEQPGKPIRVTAYALTKKLRYPFLYADKEKLPVAFGTLARTEESLYAFHLRKLRWAAAECQALGRLSKDALIRKASVARDSVESQVPYAAYIDKLIEWMRCSASGPLPDPCD